MTPHELIERGLFELAELACKDSGITVADMLERRARGAAAAAKKRFIRLLHRQRGMSPNEIGRVIGLDGTTVRLVLAGPRRALEDPIVTVVMAEAFGLSLLWRAHPEQPYGVVGRDAGSLAVETWFETLALARRSFESLTQRSA
jgi:hypothetical protein